MNPVVCIACDAKFMNDVDTNTNVLETKQKIFLSCSKYFNIELDRISCSLNIDLTKEPLPFCSNCFLSAHKVLTLHEQIEVLEREISRVVSDLKTSILKCCQQENLFSSSFTTIVKIKKDDIDYNGTATLQEKVRHYRHLVLSASGIFQEVGLSEHVPPICEVDIKQEQEAVYNTIECAFSGDMLMDHHSEEDHHYEDNDNNESEHEWASITSGKQKCKTKVLPPSEKLSNSILQLMRLYGMDKRKLVINLNRNSVLQFPKGNSAYLKKELKNNSHRIKSRNFSNRSSSNLQMKPSWTEDGFKICCGIIYIPTNDGQQQCGACNKIFSDATRLTRHIRSVHAGVKPKSYHKPKLTSKAFKVITNEEGKTSYAGVEFFELEMGKIQCGNCRKISPTVDAILRHIRWYHLGDTATEMYRQRREVYKLQRMAVLGKQVPKEKLEKVKKALKEKLYVTTIVKKAITTGDTEILTPSCSQASSSSGENKSPVKIEVKKSNRKFTFDKTEIKKVKKSNILWKDDSEEENDLEPPCEDNISEDPDFSEDRDNNMLFDVWDSPVGSPCGSVQLQSSNTEDEESDDGMNDIKKDRNEYKVVKRRGGKKFYCDIELVVTENGQQKCGKCNIQLETLVALCRHIEDVHKAQKEDDKLSKSRSTQSNRRHSKRIKGRKRSKRKIWSNRRPSESREHEKVVDKDGKMTYRGVELKILEDGRAECGVCQRISIGKRALLRHICKNHAFQNQFAKLPKAENSNNKIYKGVELWDTKDDRLACGCCWKSFVALDDLMRHIRTLHYSLKNSKENSDGKEKKKEGENSELMTCFTDEGFVYNGILCKKSDKSDVYNCGFPCDVRPVCNREFPSSYRLVSHIKKDHLVERVRINRNRIITTEDGRKTYAGVELVILDDGRAECGKCKKISPHKSALIRHIYAYHDSYMQERQFSKLPSSENGKRIYEGVEIADTKDSQFACGSCWRCFRSIDDVKRHIREHHQKSKNKNKVEEKEISKNVVNGQKNEKTKISEESKKSSKTEKEEKELENCDDETPTGGTSEGNDASKTQEEAYFTEEGFVYNGTLCKKLESGVFVCGYSILKRPLCGKEFATTFTLVNHIHKTHLENTDKKPTSRYFNRTVTTDDGRKIYAGVEMVKMNDGNMQCGACQKVFNRLSSMMSHIIRVHEQKGGHYICRYCGKNCGYKFWLVAHELRHTEDKKFTCEDCGLSYKQMSSLLHHKRQVHLKIKRHTCQICGKGYYHTRDFLLHQRRHTGEKPFQCCFCGKDFYSVYEMKNHEKVHNNDQLTNKKQQRSRPENTTSEESFKSNEKHHGASKPMRITRQTKSKGKKVGGFECDYCDEVFKTSAAVKKHVREEHSDSTSENEDDPSSTLERGENRQEKGISTATVSQNYSSQQKYPTSSWQNPISSFPMPVLEDMNPTRQSMQNSQHGSFPPILTPMYHPHNNTTPLFNPFPPQNY